MRAFACACERACVRARSGVCVCDWGCRCISVPASPSPSAQSPPVPNCSMPVPLSVPLFALSVPLFALSPPVPNRSMPVPLSTLPCEYGSDRICLSQPPPGRGGTGPRRGWHWPAAGMARLVGCSHPFAGAPATSAPGLGDHSCVSAQVSARLARISLLEEGGAAAVHGTAELKLSLGDAGGADGAAGTAAGDTVLGVLRSSLRRMQQTKTWQMDRAIRCVVGSRRRAGRALPSAWGPSWVQLTAGTRRS